MNDHYQVFVNSIGPLWYARVTGTDTADWGSNPGRWGLSRERAIERATRQARHREATTGRMIRVPRGGQK